MINALCRARAPPLPARCRRSGRLFAENLSSLFSDQKHPDHHQTNSLLIFLALNVVGHVPHTIGNPQPLPAGDAPPGGAGAAAGPPAGAPPPPAPPGGSVAPPQQAGGAYGGAPPPQQYGRPPNAAAAPYQQQQQHQQHQPHYQPPALPAPGAPPGGGGGGYGAPPPPPPHAGGPGGMYGGGARPPGPGGMYGAPSAGPVARAPGDAGAAHGGVRVVPIRSLNPYAGRWAIRGRCTVKGEVRTWSNARGEGRLLSFDLLDREGGEIRVTAFTDVCDRIDPLVRAGGVYTVSRASLKPRNAKFNPTPHEFEVYLERNSEVTAVDEDDEETRAIPAMQYNVSPSRLALFGCLVFSRSSSAFVRVARSPDAPDAAKHNDQNSHAPPSSPLLAPPPAPFSNHTPDPPPPFSNKTPQFRKLQEIEGAEAGAVLDLVGVLASVEPWGTISRRNGTETRKRNVYLRDDSGRSVEVTLWGGFANNPGDALEAASQQQAAAAAAAAGGGAPPPPPVIVAVKAARVGDFNGKSCSTIASSSVVMDPPRPEADELRAWWTSRGGASAAAVPLSERRGGGGGGGGANDRRVALAALVDEGLGTRGQPDYVTILASVGFVRNSEGTKMTYAACTRDHGGRPCSKKLQEQSGGAGGADWWCERCQQPCADPAYRYLLQLQLADHTGAAWVTAFGDTGDALMGGATAEQVREAQLAAEAERAGGDDGYGGGGGGGGGAGAGGRRLEAIVEGATFRPHLLRVKAAVETWNDEARLKVSVARVTAPNWTTESRVLLGQIARLEQGQDPFTGPAPAGAPPPAPPLAAAAGGGGYGQPPPQQQYGGGYQPPPPQQQYQQQPPQQPQYQQQQQQQQQQWQQPPPALAPPPQYGQPPPPQQPQQQPPYGQQPPPPQQGGAYYAQQPPPPQQQQQQQQQPPQQLPQQPPPPQQGGAAAASHPFAAGWA